ncbi:MAG: hypothetical protein AB7O62_16085 [Pirellulales bacterium]
MNYRLGLLLAAVLLFGGGCQNTRASLTALENENRRLEDRVYMLEDELTQHCDQVDQLDQENQQLRAQFASVSGTKPNGGINRAASEENEPTKAGNGTNGFTPPQIDLGEPATPNGVNGKNGVPTEAPGPAPPFDGPPPKFPKLIPSSDGATAMPAAYDAASFETLHEASQDATRITLDRLQSKHFVHASQQAFVVIVEPRNASGKLMAAVGDVSLVAIDTQQRGDKARLARWDFSADQAAACVRRTVLGPRMFFHLDWPQAPLENQNLRLYVRLQTVDGRFLQADAPLELPSGRSILREWSKDQVAQDLIPNDTNEASHLSASGPAQTESADSAGSPFDGAQVAEESVAMESNDAMPANESPEADEAVEEVAATEPGEYNRQAERSRPPVVRRSPRSAARRRPVWAPYR